MSGWKRILNVAEKNDAAKEISTILSRGSLRRVRIGVLIGVAIAAKVFSRSATDDQSTTKSTSSPTTFLVP